MKATIWHNPACGTSRKTLAILEETPGVEVTVIEYLKTLPALRRKRRFASAAPTQRSAASPMQAKMKSLPPWSPTPPM